jgi:hypothetical protein
LNAGLDYVDFNKYIRDWCSWNDMKSTIIIALLFTSMMANVFPPVSNIGLAYGVFHNTTANDTAAPISPQSNNSSDPSGSTDLQNIALAPASGSFTSLNNDTNHRLWITTGEWELSPDQNGSQPNSSAIGFNATIDMVTVNNTDAHTHDMLGFKSTGQSIRPETDSTILNINGTATMEIEDSLYEDIPVSVAIIDSGPIVLSIDAQTGKVSPRWEPSGDSGIIRLWIDPVKLPDHFGGTPIYGKLTD